MKFTDLYYELHTWCSRSFLIGTRPSQNSQGNIGSEAPARLFWLLLEAVEDTLLTFLSFSPLWVLPRIHEKYILRAMPTFSHKYVKYNAYMNTLRSQIEGYTRLLVCRKFSILPAVIWAYPFINFQENFPLPCFFTYKNKIFTTLPPLIRAKVPDY